MKRYLRSLSLILCSTLAFFCATDLEARDDSAVLAREVLELAGVKGGIVVHLGCGKGRLTAALRANDAYTVHGLDADSEEVRQARNYIRAKGIYGPVSAELHSGPTLPYAENLIDLVVVEEPGKVPMNEIMRVLAPGGVACIRRQGAWKKMVKPWPDNIDQWTHFLHDATNNAVARDWLVGPPGRLQWLAPPLWLRSHETPSGIQSVISAAGRLFYFFDEGLIGITDERLPDRWSLVCRDAFNGKLLWKRPLKAWGWREWSLEKWQGKDWTKLRAARVNVPAENQRRIVAAGDRLYTTLAYYAPVSILDAATGDIIATVQQTYPAREILASGGTVVVHVGQGPQSPDEQDADQPRLVAFDGKTGKVIWTRQTGQIQPLSLAIDNGRIIYLAGKELVARSLADGRKLWTARPKLTTPRTLVAVDDVIVMLAGKLVVAHDATDGRVLWEKTVPPIGGADGADLFVVNGLVWRGILSVDERGAPARKSPHALAIGWDLRSGKEKKRILVRNLRSPEHHHRCYRNKATVRYMIGSYEGAEFLDFQRDNHSQNNWIRGACRYGMVPANGLLYVPADQCFCQPGAKLPGFAALAAEPSRAPAERDDNERLEKGPAYQAIETTQYDLENDWVTYRHDPARSGSTGSSVPENVVLAWKTALQGKLTAPIAVGGRLYVAETDAHSLCALDSSTGKVLWRFTANGRIDSPPTAYQGMLLFGSRDGHVYCLRASDGKLAWRFLAAPTDRRITYFDQIESAWPVHGSILVDRGIAYFTAGRSTYLDGGIRVYALDPTTGKILHKTILKGPYPFKQGQRDLAFFILGANSDVLVSEGGYIYMRQKKMTPELEVIDVPVLSSKGAQDVGLHIFSTSSLLDGSWYNRTFWMYSRRWPGYQLANQAPKTGQLLVVGEEKTYAVRVFYRRNVHSPMFFPGKEGYLLFADVNTNEPQIVGEPGARTPVRWLPQSDYSRARGNAVRKLESEAFGLDKMIGYTRAEPPVWKLWLPVRIRAMVKAGPTLFVAGPPDTFDADAPYAPFEGRRGATLVAVSAEDGKKLAQLSLDSPPVFDGMIAARGRLFVSLSDGSVVSLAGRPSL